ncbi:MAG: carbamate kinase [Chloroflexi bacterium]|nr:carbamate kinase [Chloroflexota bacterium]
MSRVVVALGDCALVKCGELGSIADQRRNLLAAARSLVELERAGHELVVTHGSGPDVVPRAVPMRPLDVLAAEFQGEIGYLLEQALSTQLAMEGRSRPIAVVLSQVVVDPSDRSFGAPTQPIGPIYDRPTARRLAADHGWSIAPDGDGWRRVVPSPPPLEIIEAPSIRALVAAGEIVVASGCGGIPVSRTQSGALVGVEAVVDKDLAAVVLADSVDADALLLLTDVDAAEFGWGAPDRISIRRLSLQDAAAGVADGTFAPGSMGPKVRAAAEFVRRTGKVAAIGALDDAVGVLEGRSGTTLIEQSLVAVW